MQEDNRGYCTSSLCHNGSAIITGSSNNFAYIDLNCVYSRPEQQASNTRLQQLQGHTGGCSPLLPTTT